MEKFRFIPTTLTDVYLIETQVFEDRRGYFMETFQQEVFRKLGIDSHFVQDNESKSSKGVLRGLHFQTRQAQGKLVRVIQGEIFDVAVDLRVGSPSFGKAEGFILSAKNHRQLYIPAGFAHGFLVLSEEATFQYKCTEFYAPEYESGIIWNDEDLGIEWPITEDMEIVLSDKDKQLKPLKQMERVFKYEECIRKENIVLRPIKAEDIEQIRLWRNIESINKTFVNTQLISKEDQRRWYEKYKVNVSDRMMMIVLDEKPIGTVALYDIDESRKEAEFGRLLIGEYSVRGKKIGMKATEMICKYGFEKLGLTRIKLEVFKDNEYAISVYEQVGFKIVGERVEGDRVLLQMMLEKEGASLA